MLPTIQSGGPQARGQTTQLVVDPDVIDSERNHRLAGYALIGIALLVLASKLTLRGKRLGALWPLLFIAAAVFLAAWSDKEIWPRGFLSWTWLVHHDAEARQHKIYSLLLLVVGGLELLRWRNKLSPFWKHWAFPLIAASGAILLLIHDHGGSSGLPPGWDNYQKPAALVALTSHSAGPGNSPGDVTLTSEPMDMSMTDHSMMGSHNHPVTRPHDNQEEAHSSHHHGHAMTASMAHVQQQHLWFMFVGIAVAGFKFIDDRLVWHKRFVPYLWPGALAILGTLLVFYTETGH